MEIIELYRARRYYHNNKYCTWYELCKTIKITPKFIVVNSEDYPKSPLYPGGEFQVNRKRIEETGKAYHSRHGEYFFLEKPEQGDLFPSQQILTMPSALNYEAKQIGWDAETGNWNAWQKECFVFANVTGHSLREAVDLWKAGKLEAAWRWKQQKI